VIVKDVYAEYTTQGVPVHAVDGVSFDVHDGEVLGIAGESGCGKSTLAAVLSLTAHPPLIVRGGEMQLADDKTLSLTEQTSAPRLWRGKMVALLPQRAMNSLNPTARIRETVIDVVRAHDPTMTRAEVLDLARGRLESLSLPARVLESYPHQLSGGMRQRVVAIISTLLDPTVLIADEPTSALDVSSQKAFMLLLRRLLDRGFITRVIFITHDLPLLSNIANRIIVMYAGRIAEIGTTAEIIDRPQHPYSKALIGSTLDPEPGVRGARLRGLPGAPPDLRVPPSGCRFHPRCPVAMEICPREEPPAVDTPSGYATCWWVLQRKEGQAPLLQEVKR
jgi:peptide/nickel transport system ATP-binding protein